MALSIRCTTAQLGQMFSGYCLRVVSFPGRTATANAGNTTEVPSVPQAWEESDPKYISNSTDVKLRSFTTKVHKVDSMVSYKNDEEEI